MFAPNALAQLANCEPEADFTIGLPLFGCDYRFTSTYNGEADAVAHTWSIVEGNSGFAFTSNVPSLTHTFKPGTYTATVTHTVTITVGGLTTTYTCIKAVPISCSTGCLELFRYEVNGCTVKLYGNGVWNFGDGTSLTGPSPTHQYSPSGTYSVSLTVEGQTCSRSITVDRSIRPSEARTSLEIYPVPAKDRVFIRLNTAQSDATSIFTVFDGMGRTVSRGNFVGAQHTLDVSAWQSGPYVLHLQQEAGQTLTKPFFIAR